MADKTYQKLGQDKTALKAPGAMVIGSAFRLPITAPALWEYFPSVENNQGLMIFNPSDKKVYYFDGTDWVVFGTGTASKETYALPMFLTQDGVTEYTFSDLVGAELISVVVEQNHLDVAGTTPEATNDPSNGLLRIPLQFPDQRVYVTFKK